MSKSIDELLSEADEEIAGLQKESEEQNQKEQDHTKGNPYGDDESVKLAHFLEDIASNDGSSDSGGEEEKVASEDEDVDDEEFDQPFAKIAYAMAILETAMNADNIDKIDQFVKKAQDAGYSEEEIDEYLEKQSKIDPQTLKRIGALAGTGALGAGAGGYAGHEYGKRKGARRGAKAGLRKGLEAGYAKGRKDQTYRFRQRLKKLRNQQKSD